jgi:hypothetical protein
LKKSSTAYILRSHQVDLITGNILKEFPIIGIKYLTLSCSRGTSWHNAKLHRSSSSSSS